MRILQLAESPYMGGINAHIVSIAEAFRDSDAATIRVAALPGKRLDCWLFEAAPAAAEIPLSKRALRDFVKNESIDVVHTHNYRATLLAVSSRLPVPIVNTCHGMVIESSAKLRAYQWLECRAMRKLSATLAVSGFVREWLKSRGVTGPRVTTVYNGYEPEPGPGTLSRADVGAADSDVIFLFAGRCVEGKGLLEFVRAAAAVPGSFALVVGDGPLRAAGERAAKEAGGRAHFAGRQRAVAPYYRIADAVVLPSRMEALPMTLIEAAAYGKPAIATRVGGIPEIVIDRETGLLLAPSDASALAAALATCADKALCQQMGASARLRWQTHFSLRNMREKLVDVYRNVLARH